MRSKSARLILLLLAWAWSEDCSRAPTAPTPAPVTVVPPRIAEAPTLACPSPVTVTAPTSAGAVVPYPAPESQLGEGAVTVTCAPAAGAMFPVGITPVTCTATDALNRTGTCGFEIAVAAPPRLSRTRIMAFGDSVTEGQLVVPGTESVEVVARPDIAYPAVLSQLLSARYSDQRITVFNRGRATEHAAGSLSRFLSSFLSDTPDVVVLLDGYNDLLDAHGGFEILEAVAGVNEIGTEARRRGARVFICTLSPSKPGRRAIPMSAIRETNQRLREVARGENAYLVDVFSALLPEVDENVGSDGLHLTITGYRRVAETVFAAIRADLELRSPPVQ